MHILNPLFYEQNTIIRFIGDSTNALIRNNPLVAYEKDYWLLYYIHDDVSSIFNSLIWKNIDNEFVTFPSIQRSTRHAIESYLDLINLCKDSRYIDVLEKCHNKKHWVKGKYSNYLHKGMFTIPSKGNIAKEENKFDEETIDYLLKFAQNANSYAHPDVFLEPLTPNDVKQRADLLRDLLNTNFFILTNAYLFILEKYNGSQNPWLNCANCSFGGNASCNNCYHYYYQIFHDLLNSDDILVDRSAFNYNPLRHNV